MAAPQEIAVVVGATGAMGQVIVRRLAARGLRVVAVARSADAVASLVASTRNVVACAADISSDSSIDAIRAAADGTVRAEPTFDAAHVASTVVHMAELPLDTNVQFVTIMATTMPFIGRG